MNSLKKTTGSIHSMSIFSSFHLLRLTRKNSCNRHWKI